MKDMAKTKTCCGYGPDGKKVAQYDCIRIPHAEKKDGEHLVGSQFCASKNGLPTGEDAAMKEMTICSKFFSFGTYYYSVVIDLPPSCTVHIIIGAY